MKRLLAVLATVAVVVVGIGYLGFALALGTTSGGCPTALLQGTLVEIDGSLGVESVPPCTVSRVDWPFGYGVASEQGALSLTRLLSTVAREGDQVSVGGGWFGDETVFSACGLVTLGLIAPPEAIPSGPARATLTVAATAYEPCIPPPSGCGYWVRLTSPEFGTDRAPLEHHRSYESAANGDPEPLALGEGLAPWIEPGSYDLAFDVEAFSDVPSDGDPALSVACTKRLVVPVGATAVTVDATFHGSTCDVTVTW